MCWLDLSCNSQQVGDRRSTLSFEPQRDVTTQSSALFLGRFTDPRQTDSSTLTLWHQISRDEAELCSVLLSVVIPRDHKLTLFRVISACDTWSTSEEFLRKYFYCNNRLIHIYRDVQAVSVLVITAVWKDVLTTGNRKCHHAASHTHGQICAAILVRTWINQDSVPHQNWSLVPMKTASPDKVGVYARNTQTKCCPIDGQQISDFFNFSSLHSKV